MDNKYRVIVSGRRVYKEIELTPEKQEVRLGTGTDCEVRLHKELYFGQIDIIFKNIGGEWSLSCSDNIYFTAGDAKKMMTKRLNHGDVLMVKYQDTDIEVFTVEFLLDFDNGNIKYGREISISNVGTVNIGADSSCHIMMGSQYAADESVTIKREGDHAKLIVNKTAFGVYINGRKIQGSAELNNRDFIAIADYFFYFKDNSLFTGKRDDMTLNGLSYEDSKLSEAYPGFNRNTRIKTTVNDEPIEVLDPPEMPQKPKDNIITRLLPAMGMLVAAGVMAAFGGATMIIFSGISAVMSIFTAIYGIKEGNKEYKEKTQERLEKYSTYIARKRSEVDAYRDEERKTLETIYVSQEEERSRFRTFSYKLFDRTSEDEDFLCVRLGNGNVRSARGIEYKKQERLEYEDELQKEPEKLSSDYRLLSNAPVVCDLKTVNAVGIVGNDDERFDLLKNVVIDIAARHYHSDVKMVFAAEEQNKDKIYWLRMLPGVYNDQIGIRNMIYDDESKNLIFEYLYKELTAREQNKSFENNIVVFLYDDCGFKSHPISKFIQKAKELGVVFIFFGDSREEIPIGCGYIVEVKGDSEAVLINCADDGKTVKFSYPVISENEAKGIIDLLAPVYTEEISLEGSLTKNVSLFELLNIIAVDDIDLSSRWKASQIHSSMAAPLGVSKTGIVTLDLHDKKHGPHGLVAGTTGSGKSEILQTYILSMSTLFAPDEVGFVIIDFKGGGMVNQFRELPHLIGAITNIDGKEINRSLKSIKAELQKRQRLFADAEVNHIDLYIKKYKSGNAPVPLPHLIIIVDEFAELKAEQPEFMKELISAARIGRSLGVHLILATQKPAGQVDDQIWSNSRFKLCLKVQSVEDSNEVLKSPLAAEIKEPGRAYLQVGNNEIFELFQSAYSGAPARIDDSKIKEFSIFGFSKSGKKEPVFIQKKKSSGENSLTQLEAIVGYVNEYCHRSGIQKLPDICLPPLPETVFYPAESKANKGMVSIGIYDDPDNQFQGEALLDLDNKNTLIVGAAQFGKTNILQCIIRGITETSSSHEANIYILDFASMVLKNFESLKHVGGVVCSAEDEKVKNLFKLLFNEIAMRKERLLAAGVSSFSSYIEAGYKDIPHIYLIIDNLAALIELYMENDDSLLYVTREGLSVGISVIATNAQTSGIGFRYLNNFSCKVGLYCNDNSEYINMFNNSKMVPDEKPGRCILEQEKALFECQSFIAFEGEKEVDRVKSIHDYIENINKTNIVSAKAIPSIPAILTKEMLKNDFDAEPRAYKLPIGITYSEVELFYIDFSQIGTIGICGKENSGRRNFITYVVESIRSRNIPAKIVIFDDVSKKYSSLKSQVDKYILGFNGITELIDEWHETLEQRYRLSISEENEESEQELLMLIIQNNDAAKQISSNIDTMDKYTDIVTRFKGMNVCVLFANYPNSSISFDSPEPLRMIRQDQHLLYFDDLDNLKPFDVPYEEIRANRKKLGTGDGYYISGNEVVKLKVVKA